MLYKKRALRVTIKRFELPAIKQKDIIATLLLLRPLGYSARKRIARHAIIFFKDKIMGNQRSLRKSLQLNLPCEQWGNRNLKNYKITAEETPREKKKE
jgi:hypothetical protein